MKKKRPNEWTPALNKAGRKRIFENAEALWKAACGYFQECIDNPVTLSEKKYKALIVDKAEDDASMDELENKIKTFPQPMTWTAFCNYCGVAEAYFRQFRSGQKGCEPEFSAVIQRIDSIIEKNLFQGASVGAYNANIISRKLGLYDKMIQENVNVNYNTNISPEEAKSIAAGLNGLI